MPGPVFDSGLPRAQRTLLRAAIATQLSPLLRANGGYLAAIRQLPRPLKSGSEEELAWIGQILQGQAPCVLIALGRSDLEDSGMDILPVEVRAKIEVAIYVASNSARNYVDGRLDNDVVSAASSSADPGIEAMLEQVEEYLLGQSFDLATGLIDRGIAPASSAPKHVTSELQFEREDEVYTGGDVTVWEARGNIHVQREINPNRALAQLLLTIEGQHSLEGADPANPVVDTVATLEAP